MFDYKGKRVKFVTHSSHTYIVDDTGEVPELLLQDARTFPILSVLGFAVGSDASFVVSQAGRVSNLTTSRVAEITVM